MKHSFGLVLLLSLGLLGCKRPSPLGTLDHDDLAKWSADCEAPIVVENPHDPKTPGPVLRGGDSAFARATERFRCPPPGWAVYTDNKDRVVGLCVDDDTRPFLNSQGSFEETVHHETDRARSLIAAHWGTKLAGDMLRDVGDHCSPDSMNIGHGMIRWGTSQLTYLDPSKIHSQFMCCWEVKD